MIPNIVVGKSIKRYSPHENDKYHAIEGWPEMEQKRSLANEITVWICAILCILFCLAGCRNEELQASRLPEKTSVILKEVTQISTEKIIFVSGSLEADKTAPLNFLVPGKVNRVYVGEGDYVKRDQLLASVESDDYKSNLKIAEAILLKAQDAYDRYKPLYKEGVFAEKNFIELKAGLAQAIAGRDAHPHQPAGQHATPVRLLGRGAGAGCVGHGRVLRRLELQRVLGVEQVRLVSRTELVDELAGPEV